MEVRCDLSLHNSSLRSNREVNRGGEERGGEGETAMFNTDGRTNAPFFLTILSFVLWSNHLSYSLPLLLFISFFLPFAVSLSNL